MKTILNLSAALLLFAMFVGCKKDLVTGLDGESTMVAVSNDTVYTSDRSKNLTIIYFIPSDLDTIAGFHARISRNFLWFQNYVKNEMNRNGYGNKTFGMQIDSAKQLVKINIVRAQQPKIFYRYSNGGGPTINELNQYFAANPGIKTSEHVMVLFPWFGKEPDGSEIGSPFFGSGRWCFATDRVGNDVGLAGTPAFELGSYGGMMHELIHGLNGPHNSELKSERAANQVSLMRFHGDLTKITPITVLSKALCAILNRNEIFNNDGLTYYQAVQTTFNKFYVSYDAGKSAIIASGRYTSSNPVSDITIYNDPNVSGEGTGVNKDYNALTWVANKVGVDSFYVEMPISEFFNKDASPYEMKFRIVAQNGTIVEKINPFKWVNGLPVFDFVLPNELNKSGWSIFDKSSEQTTAPAVQLIDGMPGTSWHSRWSTSPVGVYPHHVTIDLGSAKTATAFAVINGLNGGGRFVKDVEAFSSNDGTNFTSLGTFTLLKNSENTAYNFGSSQTFRYFKLKMINSYDGTQNAQMAEIGLINQ